MEINLKLLIVKQQIKVKDTRMHKVPKFHYEGGTPVAFKTTEILTVAEAKLVLVYLPFEEATGNILCQCIKEMADVKIGEIQLQHKLVTSLDYWRPVKPILISETEKIEVGEVCIGEENKELFAIGKAVEVYGNNHCWIEGERIDYHYKAYKILALPKHFSPKHLQAIVDGKLKDGDKVLVECEELGKYGNVVLIKSPHNNESNSDMSVYSTYIKLNSSNHITLHKIEERTYTREEVLEILEEYRKAVLDEVSANLYTPSINKWFEQNVK